MDLSRWGFDKKIQNVDNLDKIYDLLKGKISYKKIGYTTYLVWEDNAITKEVKELQKSLSKPWYSYKNYNCSNRIWKAFSNSEYLEELKKYQEEEKRKVEKCRKKEEKELEKENANRGIYGIYLNGELIYIGKTDVSFEVRYQQHKKAIEEGSEAQYLYKYLKGKMNGNDVRLKPIINVKELNTKDRITNRDIEAMELALIHLYQPKCNIQGVLQPYKFK